MTAYQEQQQQQQQQQAVYRQDADAELQSSSSASPSANTHHRRKGQPKRLPKAGVHNSTMHSNHNITAVPAGASTGPSQQQQQVAQGPAEPCNAAAAAAAAANNASCLVNERTSRAAVIVHNNTPAHPQQQQQQQQVLGPQQATMTTEALLQLMDKKQPQLQRNKKHIKLLDALAGQRHGFAAAGQPALAGQPEGSSDAAALLTRIPVLLLPHLQETISSGKYSPKTAADVVQGLKHVVLLPEVQALFSSADAEALVEQLRAARAEFLAQQKQYPSKKADAAIAALIVMIEERCNGQAMPLQQQKNRQQQQQQQQQQLPSPPLPVSPPPPQQQQQQQQQRGMSVQQLQQLMFIHCSWSHKVSAAVNTWSKVCGSADVALLLQGFASLLQHVRATHAAATCYDYMRAVLKILELPEVQQLLGSQQQLQVLQDEAQVARDQFRAEDLAAKATAASAGEAAHAVAVDALTEAATAVFEADDSQAGAAAAAAAAAAAVHSQYRRRKRLAGQQVGPARHSRVEQSTMIVFDCWLFCCKAQNSWQLASFA
jgi:hypothetical protein